MQDEIPILVSQHAPAASPFYQPVLLRPRKPTPMRTIRTHQDTRQHPQLSLPLATRTRRISSSTAAKRFPKDFFLPDPHCQSRNLQTQAFRQNQKYTNNEDEKQKMKGRDSSQNLIDSPKSQRTPEFKKEKSSEKALKDERRKLLSEKQALSRDPFKDESLYRSVVDSSTKKNNYPGSNVESKQRDGITQITFQLNNFNVTLGQKINNAIMIKREKERKRISKMRETGQENQGTCTVFKRDSHGFRIRRKGLV